MTKGAEKIKDKTARERQGKEKLTPPISCKPQSTCKVRYLNSDAPQKCQGLYSRITDSQLEKYVLQSLKMSINCEKNITAYT